MMDESAPNNFIERTYLSHYSHNAQATSFFVESKASKPIPKISSVDTRLFYNRQEINEGRLKVVSEYMKFYSDVIKEAISRNNCEIYTELKKFIESSTH